MPICIAIPLDLQRKNGAMMQEANVSHGKTKDGHDVVEIVTMRSPFVVVL
jgi:hypothetical protein